MKRVMYGGAHTFTKRNVIAIAVIACTLLLLATPWSVFAGEGDDESSWPLDGIWITTYPTPMGNVFSTTVYVAQDAAKTRYSGTLEFVNAFPLLAELYPEADPTLEVSAGGEAVMVGPNKYEATFLSYERKIDHDMGTMEIVGLATAKAHFELLDPDTLQGQGTGSYYLASQDADEDGFPDEGEEPVACFPWSWTGKRLTPLPGCTPPPLQ